MSKASGETEGSVSHRGKKKQAIENPWRKSWEDVLNEFGVSKEKGLNENEVRGNRRRYGSNRLRKPRRKSTWVILIDQFKNFIVFLLAVAAVFSFIFGQWLEGVSIVIAIFVNAAIGFFTELNATRSMEALHRMSRVGAKVRRGGEIKEIPAENLVPGDLVLLEGGDLISADMRLIEASRLRADEAALTGGELVGRFIYRVLEKALS